MLQSGLRGLCRLPRTLVPSQACHHMRKLPQQRGMSGLPASPFIKVSMDEKAGVAEMELCRAPANALTLEFLQHLTGSIKALEADTKCRGVIFTSKLPGIFSGGLELGELYQPDLDRLRKFWVALQDMWCTLYSTNLITVAAISGHAYAGGTSFILACDVSVMVEGNYLTGFAAPTLGIMVPLWLQDNMINVIGHRQAEYALQQGSLFSPTQALDVGLVHHLVPPLELSRTVKKEMDTYLKIPDPARQLSKMTVRQKTIDRFHNVRQEDLDIQMKLIPGAACQNILEAHLDRLKKKTRRIDT